MKNTAKDFIEDKNEFQKLLDQAEKSAETDWQISFVDSISTAYGKWGIYIRLSQKQYDQLIQIAGW